MRVALDARLFGVRGIGRYTEALHRGLLARKDRVHVTAFGRAASGREGTWQRLRLPGYVAQEQLEMSWRIRRGDLDVVHLTGNTAPLVRAGWPPTVVTVHDVLYLRGPRELPLSPSVRQVLGRAYRRMAFLTGTRHVDHLISDSAATARELDRRLGGKLPPVTVVPPAVDAAFTRAIDPAVLRAIIGRYGQRERGYFLHAGGIDPRKNTRTVVEAFRRYRAAGGTGSLVVMGMPERGRASLEASARGEPAITVLPFIPNDDVVGLVKGALAVVYVPSAEGFGYPLVEALAAGTPAIVSAIDVLREIAQGAALEVPARDVSALETALASADADPDRLAGLAARGRDRAAAFTVERMTESVLDVYADAVARSRARRSDL